MHRLEVPDPAPVVSALRSLALRSENAVLMHRLHCLLLMALGWRCRQLAEWFGHDRRTLERWVHRFESGGVEGLREHPRPGRSARLGPEELQLLRRDLALDPEQLGYRQPAWNAALLARHIEGRFAIELGKRQCQRLLGALKSGVEPPADPGREGAKPT